MPVPPVYGVLRWNIETGEGEAAERRSSGARNTACTYQSGQEAPIPAQRRNELIDITAEAKILGANTEQYLVVFLCVAYCHHTEYTPYRTVLKNNLRGQVISVLNKLKVLQTVRHDNLASVGRVSHLLAPLVSLMN